MKATLQRNTIHRVVYTFLCIYTLIYTAALYAQGTDIETKQRNIIHYGTDGEITSLLGSIKKDNITYLDDDLRSLCGTTQSPAILAGLFSYFGDKPVDTVSGVALNIVRNRDDYDAPLVASAIDYLGKARNSNAPEVLRGIIDEGDAQFLSSAIRAYGKSVASYFHNSQ